MCPSEPTGRDLDAENKALYELIQDAPPSYIGGSKAVPAWVNQILISWHPEGKWSPQCGCAVFDAGNDIAYPMAFSGPKQKWVCDRCPTELSYQQIYEHWDHIRGHGGMAPDQFRIRNRIPTLPWWCPKWVARIAWGVSYRAYYWLEDRRPGGGFR